MTMTRCYDMHMCPFCQRVVSGDPIVTDSIAPSDYDIELLKPYAHDAHFRVYYRDDRVLEQLQSYLLFACPTCARTFAQHRDFARHVKAEHGLHVCGICERANRALPSQVSAFGPADFKFHMRHHPKCPVCPMQVFDDAVLGEHMRANHFRCDICANNGRLLWFETLPLIQVHFHTAHFACEDPICVSQGVIAFETAVELHLHRINVHGHSGPLEIDSRPPPNAPDWEDERVRRIRAAKQRLRDAIKRTFPGEDGIAKTIAAIVRQVEDGRIGAADAIARLGQACKGRLDQFFCAIMATIEVPGVRAEIVRIRTGVEADPHGQHAEVPPPPPPPRPPPAGRPGKKKGRGKKIVIMST
jgi:uncharacterized C2H2 Zn-finger protein